MKRETYILPLVIFLYITIPLVWIAVYASADNPLMSSNTNGLEERKLLNEELKRLRKRLHDVESNPIRRGAIAIQELSQSAKALEMIELDLPNGIVDVSRGTILTGNEKTWEEIRQRIENRYQTLKEELNKIWGFRDELQRAIFYTAAVANMWRIGDPKYGGGVRGFYKRNYGGRLVPVNAYIQSKEAECNDFAIMLYMMLKLAGYKARHVGTKDHIYVEVIVNGLSYVMDAMYGVITQMTNQEFLKQGKRKSVYFLIPYGASRRWSQTYREKGAAMRNLYLLTRGRIEFKPSKDYSHWDRFSLWRKLNAIEMDGNIQGLG